MAGLPAGWEWDYDGQRWFYKYKPTGHIQYHFPSEGDEFPDFIEAGSPAPVLAPEERLESQQQVKRQSSSAGHGIGSGSKRVPRDTTGNGVANKYGMSATAKPINAVWEDDEETEPDGVFQPENFMFLGPGTYIDVSPLMEEEDEAAKRTVVGNIGERVEGAGTPSTAAANLAKGVSPLASGKTTPMMTKSEPSVQPKPVDDSVEIAASVESPPVIESPHRAEGEPASAPAMLVVESTTTPTEAFDHAEVHMIDSREMPVEMMGDTMHRFNPVGFVAEMPTEHTAVAHIELHPDPVEIADNTVLAPIETGTAASSTTGMAELPAKNSPVDRKEALIVNAPEGSERADHSPMDETTANYDVHQVQQMLTRHTDSLQPVQEEARDQQTTPLVTADCVQQQTSQDPRRDYEYDNIQQAEQTHMQPLAPLKLDLFKIARKQPGSAPGTPLAQQSQQASYPTRGMGQATISTNSSSSEKRQSFGLQREASLMMDTPRGSISIDPSGVPRVLSLPQRPQPCDSTQSGAPSPPQLATGESRDNSSLAHIPSVLKPARNRNSIQALPQPQQAAVSHAASTPTPAAQQEYQGAEGVTKFPSVLRPARGRSSSQTEQCVTVPVQSQGQPQIAQQLGQKVPQLPIQRPPWHSAQVEQPARPASSMPSMGHMPYGSQYAAAGPAASLHQQQSSQPMPSDHHLPISGQPLPLKQMQDAISSQPPRPQTALGTFPVSDANAAKASVTPSEQQTLAFQGQPLHSINNDTAGPPDVPQYVQQLPVDSQPTFDPHLQERPQECQSDFPPTQPAQGVNGSQTQHQLPASFFQVQAIQNVQNVAAGQPNPPLSALHAVNASQNAATGALPPKQQSPTSIFEVQPLQHIQNAAAGQPIRPQSVQTQSHTVLDIAHRPVGSRIDTAQRQESTVAQYTATPAMPSQNPPPGELQQSLQRPDVSHFQEPALQHIQNLAARQPLRPQSVIGTVQHTPASKSSQSASLATVQQVGVYGPVHPIKRRASTFTSGEASPVRPRENSQVSALGSPSPLDPSRRGSSNTTVNGMSFTPSPLTDPAGPVMQNSQNPTLSSSTQGPRPPVPAKIREHAQGSFFPTQNAPGTPPSQDPSLTHDQMKYQQQPSPQRVTSQPPKGHQQQTPSQLNQSKQSLSQDKQLPKEPTQDTEHPIGYQIKLSNSQPSTILTGNSGISAPVSGHVLGRIEEHDEGGQGAQNEQTSQVTRPSSMASSIQHSIPDTPGSFHGPKLPQPNPLASGQTHQSGQAPGQSQMIQSSMSQPLTGQVPMGQSFPGQQPQSMILPNQMQGQQQSQLPPGQNTTPMPLQTQGHWNPALGPNVPTQEGKEKEKEKKWTKWFKGGNSKPKSAAPQMLPPQPGPIPGPGPQQWAGGPYSPNHFWQQPGQQGPFSHGKRPSLSDSASISTVGSDRRSYHSQHVLPGQAGGPVQQPGPSSQLPPGQMPQPQFMQGQLHPTAMAPGYGPPPGQFVSGQISPRQVPAAQPSHNQIHPGQQVPSPAPPGLLHGGQVAPGQPDFGQMHPLQMPINNHTQGFASPRPGVQSQGQMGIEYQGSQNSHQPATGHPSSQSTSSGVKPHQQVMVPQQTQAPAGPQSQSPDKTIMPAPLFTSASGNPPVSGLPAHMQVPPANHPPAINKWAQGPTADYSGGEWGDDENWERR